ncbi:MAG: hypothetical protein KGL39_12385 [Patescibacteria group bacterium]|nr:hypothetical protein [Patescibacteria group bacterium]
MTAPVKKPSRFRTGQIHDDYRHSRSVPNPETLAERDARRTAYFAMRDSDRLMGDPPPGFSALDRRK